MSHFTKSGIKTGRKSQTIVFSRVSQGMLGTFWARFWRRSVLQGHCVSLSGRVRFEPREEEATLVVVMRVNLCSSQPSEGRPLT